MIYDIANLTVDHDLSYFLWSRADFPDGFNDYCTDS